MEYQTKAIRLSLLNEQLDALVILSKQGNQSLSQALITFLKTTNLNVPNDNSQSNTFSH